jgi:hypothetical protein
MRLFRPKLITEMEREQRLCRKESVREDEIVHHLIEKYHPSWIELRYVRYPLEHFLPDPKHEGVFMAEKLLRAYVRVWNKAHRLDQEIAAKKIPWQTLENKIRKVWLLELAAGDVAKEAIKRVESTITGNMEKRKRLADKVRNSSKVRSRAKRTEVQIEKRIRGGAKP